ncbi:endonuclease/exonuclease/phosphatase family protein [Haladaptatus sp. YSMS36]|uniref:endonuclease/exonuclease/phosphatase family protein n=1 Tax=Haladaptatus sp. YSMS36 TaxID=3033384 RepID=UPI0023E8C5CF|nr:endonuclease/exonuclease/phosphatase family protein [Haladaptatus sp. YSMS36]
MSIRVMSWNVDGTFPPAGSSAAVNAKVEWLDSLEQLPDILLFQEVNPNQRELWHELLLETLGYTALTDTIEWARDLANSNGHITAVREDWRLSENRFGRDSTGTPVELDTLDTAFPEKILITDIELPQATIEVLNIRAVPGSSWGVEKIIILEQVYEWMTTTGEKPRILAGDFNAPNTELADGQAIPFGYEKEAEIRNRWVSAELNLLKGIGHIGLIDAFRAVHGYGDIDQVDLSWDRTKRFDHLFMSEEFGLNDCRYLSEGYDYSDHAPIVAEFEI